MATLELYTKVRFSLFVRFFFCIFKVIHHLSSFAAAPIICGSIKKKHETKIALPPPGACSSV